MQQLKDIPWNTFDWKWFFHVLWHPTQVNKKSSDKVCNKMSPKEIIGKEKNKCSSWAYLFITSFHFPSICFSLLSFPIFILHPNIFLLLLQTQQPNSGYSLTTIDSFPQQDTINSILSCRFNFCSQNHQNAKQKA